jgi:hypothetical protein
MVINSLRVIFWGRIRFSVIVRFRTSSRVQI